MIFENIDKMYTDFVQQTKGEVYIFCPYIKVATLKKVLATSLPSLSIVTTWKTLDILNGISELELYSFCKSIKARLYINQKIHLKLITDLYEKAIVGSANITDRGLGISPEANHECVVLCEQVTFDDQIHLQKIIQEATLLNDMLFSEFEKAVAEAKREYTKVNMRDVDIKSAVNKNFLISALPMSRSIRVLYTYYSDRANKVKDDTDYNCAIHDIALYDIPPGLNEVALYQHIKESFFNHPFIKKLKDFIGKEKYFGQIKEWVQATCVDVPVPSRRDLTGNVQVLYEWFALLGKEEYEVDRPHHSQRIFKK